MPRELHVGAAVDYCAIAFLAARSLVPHGNPCFKIYADENASAKLHQLDVIAFWNGLPVAFQKCMGLWFDCEESGRASNVSMRCPFSHSSGVTLRIVCSL